MSRPLFPSAGQPELIRRCFFFSRFPVFGKLIGGGSRKECQLYIHVCLFGCSCLFNDCLNSWPSNTLFNKPMRSFVKPTAVCLASKAAWLQLTLRISGFQTAARSVVLVLQHDSRGSKGMLLNKPSKLEVELDPAGELDDGFSMGI